MQTSIPQIEVITAIEDPEFEEYVSQLLYSQGWSIIYRLIDGRELRALLESRVGLRTVLVYTSTLADFPIDIVGEERSLGFTAISLDSLNSQKIPHLIMAEIRGKVRGVPVQQRRAVTPASLQRSIEKKRVITVTGSNGSPGRTLITTALAKELSLTWQVVAVDADFRTRSLSKSAPQLPFEVASLNPDERPLGIPEMGEQTLVLVDAGPLPVLRNLESDRRWSAAFTCSLLESTSHIVYICNTTLTSQSELREFLQGNSHTLAGKEKTFICLSQGTSRSDREAIEGFETLVTGHRSIVLPFRAVKEPSTLLGAAPRGPAKSKREIARIALSLI